MYEWEGTLYLQLAGGPIGLRSSGPVARILMDFWVNELLAIAERSVTLNTENPIAYGKLEIHLITKYVDDIFTALERLRPGMRWNQAERALKWDPQSQERDANETPEQAEIRTMTEVQKIASSVLECLNFTNDTPANNATLKMPVLDTQMWVGEEARVEGIPQELINDQPRTQMGELNRIILYQFFKKPMADRVPNRKDNALPEQQKVTTATQEIIRRFKLTSRAVPKEIIEQVLKEYMGELEAGGYPLYWRRRALESAAKGYSRMRDKEIKGTGYINRPASHGVMKRRAEKLTGKGNWSKDKEYIRDDGKENEPRETRKKRHDHKQMT